MTISAQRTSVDRPVAPTLVRRIMDHGIAIGMDRRVASVLGRLYLEGVLTETECEAGMRFAEDCGRYERIKGFPSRSVSSPAFETGYGDDRLDLDALKRMDPEAAARIEESIRRRVRRAEKAYDRALSYIPENPAIAREVIDNLCCNDHPVHSLHHAGVKAILGTLATRCYRLNPMLSVEEERPHNKKVTRKADARDLAGGAMDTLEQNFARAGATVASFELGGARGGKLYARRLVGHGWNEDGEKITKFIEVRMRGMLPAVFEAQIAKLAISRGWKEVNGGGENVEGV